jgi:hypothetical protein
MLAVTLGVYGCRYFDSWGREKPPYDAQFHESYEQTLLRMSSSAEVLTTIHIPESELLSQSKSVVASVGQKENGYKTWLKMVAFDENRLTAKRKYLMIVDDRLDLMEQPKKSMSLDCEMVMDREILDNPYANENARRIAVLREVLQNARRDSGEVGPDNKTIDICGMLINQALEAALAELDSSPALAVKLSQPVGLDFSHITFGRGKIQMLVHLDVVKVKMRLGRLVKNWDDAQENAQEHESGRRPIYY